MKTSATLLLALDDLIADLRHARRLGDLGRLALIAYCEARPWARKVGQLELADFLSEMMTASPHPSRASFLGHIDQLIFELLRLHDQFAIGTDTDMPGGVTIIPDGNGHGAAHG